MANSSQTPILVLGAGELGMAVLGSLAERRARIPGGSITALLRPSTISSTDPAKRREVAKLRSLGIDLLPGDLAYSHDAMVATFKNFHTVIGCTGFAAGEQIQLKIARAVLDAAVKRYIPWQFGVDYDVIGRGSAQNLFDEQLDVRDLLRSQGSTEWIIISTGMFTSFLFEPSFGVVDLAENVVHALGSWDTAVTVTTPEDIGTLTAEILLADQRVGNRIVYTAGDTITYARMADVIDSVRDQRVQRMIWSVPRLKKDLEKDPTHPIKKYRVVFAAGRGVSWEMTQTFNARERIETMNVERWLRKHLGVINRA